MLIHPQINPIALQIGPISIYWYGLSYVMAFLGCCFLIEQRLKQKHWQYLSSSMKEDLLFFGGIGVVIGGRIGNFILYEPLYLLHFPWKLFAVWEGGMSFHGGLLGCMIGILYTARRYNKKFLSLADLVCSFISITQICGRLGNFINAEILGKATNLPWGMYYPHIDEVVRHPIQLYHAFIDGFLVFLLLWILGNKPRPTGQLSGIFLISYAITRSFTELFREADFTLSFGITVSAGQLYSIPPFLFGVGLLAYSSITRQPPPS